MSDLNDEAVAVQTARVGACATRWAQTLGLTGWRFHHLYFRSGWLDEHNPRLWSPSAASTSPDFKYKQAQIKWNLELISEVSDEDLERLVIHELVHCLADEFKQHAMQEMGDQPMHHASMERQVTELELAIWWAYEQGHEDAASATTETGE